MLCSDKQGVVWATVGAERVEPFGSDSRLFLILWLTCNIFFLLRPSFLSSFFSLSFSFSLPFLPSFSLSPFSPFYCRSSFLPLITSLFTLKAVIFLRLDGGLHRVNYSRNCVV
jgi:hypothetical protein